MDKYFPKDDEYHFNEPSSSDLFGTPPKTNPIVERLKNKRVYAIIGAIVFLYIIYKIIAAMMAPSSTITATPKKVQTTTTTTVSPMQVLNERLSEVEAKTANTNTRLERVEQSSNNLDAGMKELQGQVNNLNQALQVLSNQITQQQAQMTEWVEMQKKMMEPKTIVRRRGRAVQLPCYNLQGLVPGRAWLRRSDGAIFTVQVGDELPGYGVVQAIDPLQATVTTSSGIIIEYHPKDR